MEWFHCNKCFIRRGSTFAVSTCGHICCEACIKSAKAAKCVICGTSCKYIPITDKMKPQDKMFFMDPVELLVSRLERILQITNFQRTQMERTTAYFKHKSVELEKLLKEVTQQSYRQIAELKRENADLKSQNMELQREMAELKKPLSQRGSPSPFQTNGVRRISLPVAVTPPVSAHSRTMSPMWPRNRGLGLASRRVKVLDQSLLCRATALFFNMDAAGPQFPTPRLQEAQAFSSSVKWLLYQYTHLGIDQTG